MRRARTSSRHGPRARFGRHARSSNRITRRPRAAPAPLLAPTYLQSQQPAGCKNLSRRSPGLAFLRHPIITDSATRAEQIPLPGNEQPNCSSRLSDMTTSIRQRFDRQRDIIFYELALGTRHRGAPVTRQALYRKHVTTFVKCWPELARSERHGGMQR